MQLLYCECKRKFVLGVWYIFGGRMKSVRFHYYAFLYSFLFNRMHSFSLLFLKGSWSTRNLLLSDFRKSFVFFRYIAVKVQQVESTSWRKKYQRVSGYFCVQMLFSLSQQIIRTLFACAEKISFLRVEKKYLFAQRENIFLRGTFNKIVFWGNFRSIMQVSVFSFVKIIHSVFKTKNLFVRKVERLSNGEATLRLFCKFFPLEPKSCANSFRCFNLGFLLFFNRRVN